MIARTNSHPSYILKQLYLALRAWAYFDKNINLSELHFVIRLKSTTAKAYCSDKDLARNCPIILLQ